MGAPMPNINDPAFWEEMSRNVWGDIAPALLKIYYRGLEQAIGELPPNAFVFLSWDTINEGALRWLDNYRLRNLGGIDEYTRTRASRIIEQWIQSGEPMPVLETKLIPVFGTARAARIAITEITRIYAAANIDAWMNSGVVNANRWNTARDELVCPICGPLDGTTSPLGQYGFAAGGQYLIGPPAHPNCRCWLTPIVDESLYQQAIERILREGA